ncbi:MAG TPA: Gfo/Idh/MocA family oxidoreductase, partial [Candidatus Lokiarchaeia archaeon]|nr:Gfo/Idh/MocA family oxidoreductase [Candidatus Lokiarchaeia archaeon]
MDKTWANVGIVGCGHIYNDGHKKTFLHPASTNNAVIAFCDPDEKRAKDALSWVKKGYQKLLKTAKKQSKTAEVERLTFAFDHLKTYTSLEQMLDDLEGTLDVIDNCTPGRLHIPLSVQAMQRGVHAMAEKPPGLNWWDVKRAVVAEQETGKHYELLECVCYDRPIQQCRKVIEDGVLGKILEMSVPYGHGGPYIPYFFPPSGLPHFIDPLWAGGGCVQDLAPHGISKGLWSVGPGVRAVSCETAKLERRKKPRVMSRKPFDSNVDDWAEADLEVYDPRTDSNFEMHVVTSWCGGLAFGFSIEGENGLLLIDKDHPV